jgi:hypothetical protein
MDTDIEDLLKRNFCPGNRQVFLYTLHVPKEFLCNDPTTRGFSHYSFVVHPDSWSKARVAWARMEPEDLPRTLLCYDSSRDWNRQFLWTEDLVWIAAKLILAEVSYGRR